MCLLLCHAPHVAVLGLLLTLCHVQLELTGPTFEEAPPTVSNETTLKSICAVHQRLEARRQSAAKTGSYGPRVLLAGPTDVGKSTAQRTLAGYAARLGWAPTIVDTDLGQGDLLVPGSIAASPVNLRCADVTSPTGWSGLTPLAYYPGSASPSDVDRVWRHHVQQLANVVNKRMATDAAARAAGLFVNTMGWVEKGGYDLLLHAIKALHIDVVLVLGNEALVTRLRGAKGLAGLKLPPLPRPVSDPVVQSTSGAKSSAAAGAGAAAGGDADAAAGDEYEEAPPVLPPQDHDVAVVYAKRSEGVVARNSKSRQDARSVRIKQYFYGTGEKQPSSRTLKLDDVHIVTVGGAMLHQSVLPFGAKSMLHPLRVNAVTEDTELEGLVNKLLAVSFAANETAVPHMNIAGFVHVQKVNVRRRTITVLCPNSGDLPGKYLIAGKIAWVD